MTRWALLALAGLLLAGSALAQSDSLEAAKRRELDEVKRLARENREAAGRLKGRETVEVTKLRRTERELNLTRKRLRALQQKRRTLDRQLDVTRADLERSVLTLQRQRARLARRLRNLYKFGAGRELEFLLSPRSFGQLLARWDFLVMIAEQDRLLLEEVRGEKEQVEVNQQRLELNLGDIQRTAQRTTAENSRLDRLRRERASTVRTIQTQRGVYEAAAAELERRRKAEADRARAEGRNPQPYSGDFAKGQGALDWPARGPLVGRFGPETHPKWGTVTPNNGIDIQVAAGTPVHAVAKGRVEYTSEDYASYGQMLILNHGDGFFTLYAHLSQILVAVGQEVVPGQAVARSGETGSLKGPVLHFEVRRGGAALDPEEWLR